MAEDGARKSAARNTAKYTTLEQIEARRRELDEMRARIEKERKELDRSGREIARSHDRLRAAMVGRFVQSRRPGLWEEITGSPEFDGYVNRDADRRVWGFPPLESSGGDPGVKTHPSESDSGAETSSPEEDPDSKPPPPPDENPGPEPPPQDGAGAGGRLYLSVSYRERNELKELAGEVLGEGYRGKSLEFDRASKRWYLTGEGIGKAGAFARWLPVQDKLDG